MKINNFFKRFNKNSRNVQEPKITKTDVLQKKNAFEAASTSLRLEIDKLKALESRHPDDKINVDKEIYPRPLILKKNKAELQAEKSYLRVLEAYEKQNHIYYR